MRSPQLHGARRMAGRRPLEWMQAAGLSSAAVLLQQRGGTARATAACGLYIGGALLCTVTMLPLYMRDSAVDSGQAAVRAQQQFAEFRASEAAVRKRLEDARPAADPPAMQELERTVREAEAARDRLREERDKLAAQAAEQLRGLPETTPLPPPSPSPAPPHEARRWDHASAATPAPTDSGRVDVMLAAVRRRAAELESQRSRSEAGDRPAADAAAGGSVATEEAHPGLPVRAARDIRIGGAVIVRKGAPGVIQASEPDARTGKWSMQFVGLFGPARPVVVGVSLLDVLHSKPQGGSAGVETRPAGHVGASRAQLRGAVAGRGTGRRAAPSASPASASPSAPRGGRAEGTAQVAATAAPPTPAPPTPAPAGLTPSPPAPASPTAGSANATA
eukprot:TRINITY_DN15106_c0_g1_i1.p1 TRINITY_DN15106_c0_g1~~TRINITY_DN15106_c0_g1_i1.p1  ORF type:complete len:391 (+),score=86.29 TRINITY_DN15106_c0_g1_i1:70-1242(+)